MTIVLAFYFGGAVATYPIYKVISDEEGLPWAAGVVRALVWPVLVGQILLDDGEEG